MSPGTCPSHPLGTGPPCTSGVRVSWAGLPRILFATRPPRTHSPSAAMSGQLSAPAPWETRVLSPLFPRENENPDLYAPGARRGAPQDPARLSKVGMEAERGLPVPQSWGTPGKSPRGPQARQPALGPGVMSRGPGNADPTPAPWGWVPETEPQLHPGPGG